MFPVSASPIPSLKMLFYGPLQLTDFSAQPVYDAAMDVIYVDRLFFLDALSDYLLLLLTARFCSLVLRRGRYVLAALLGGAYSVAAVLPGFAFLAAPWWKLGVGAVMTAVAFLGERHLLRCGLSFLLLTSAFGGAIRALGGLRPRSLFLSFALCYVLLSLFFRRAGARPERARAEVRLRFLGREARFTALLDSGNALRDPVTGRAVLVVSDRVMAELLPAQAALFAQADGLELLELLQQQGRLARRFRLLPYAALGVSGLLPVFRPEEAAVDGRARDDLLVAVSRDAHGADFEGIL